MTLLVQIPWEAIVGIAVVVGAIILVIVLAVLSVSRRSRP